jgi:hypothetical protein
MEPPAPGSAAAPSARSSSEEGGSETGRGAAFAGLGVRPWRPEERTCRGWAIGSSQRPRRCYRRSPSSGALLPAADEISDVGGQADAKGSPARRQPPISARSLRGVVWHARIRSGDPKDARDPALSVPGDCSPSRGHTDADRDVRMGKGASFSTRTMEKDGGTAGRGIRGSYSASDDLRSADKDTLARLLLLRLSRCQIQARCRGVSTSFHSLFGEPIPSLMTLFLLPLSPGAPVKVAAAYDDENRRTRVRTRGAFVPCTTVPAFAL